MEDFVNCWCVPWRQADKWMKGRETEGCMKKRLSFWPGPAGVGWNFFPQPQARELCFSMWGLRRVHVGLPVPYSFPCVWAPRQILWCDVRCEFRDRGRWKRFVVKSTKPQKWKMWGSVWVWVAENSCNWEWEWWWLIARVKTHANTWWAPSDLHRKWLKCSILRFALVTKTQRFALQVSCQEIRTLESKFSIFNETLFVCMCTSWVSVLQNSKEEALNTALGGDQLHLQDSGLQELSRAIIAELRHMPGNEACADCGAPGQPSNDMSMICAVYYRLILAFVLRYALIFKLFCWGGEKMLGLMI